MQAPTLISSLLNKTMMPELYVPNDKYDVVITQVSGIDTFTMIDRGTYADPNPMVKNNTEAFNVYGVWNVAMTTLAKVNFTCMLMGVEVYTMDYACAGTGNDYGHCPGTTGIAGEEWTASFGFDVPAIAPPFEYDATITAFDTSNNALFQLSSKFFIP